MPCHDSAVALNTQAMAPISSVGQTGPVSANSATLPAMPSAKPAIIARGVTCVLPSQPHKIRHGTAVATATENTNPAATGV